MNEKLKIMLQNVLKADNSKDTVKKLLTKLFGKIINDEKLYNQIDFISIIQFIADSTGVVLDSVDCDSLTLEDVIQLIIVETVPGYENESQSPIGGSHYSSPPDWYAKRDELFDDNSSSATHNPMTTRPISAQRSTQKPNYRFSMKNRRNGFDHTPDTVGKSGCNGFSNNNDPSSACYDAM